MIKRILMPIDGSEVSGRIQSWVAGLAKSMDSEIVLLTVVNPDKIVLPEAIAVGERSSVHIPSHGSPVRDRETVGMPGPPFVDPAVDFGIEPEPSPMFSTKFTDLSIRDAIHRISDLADQLRSEGLRTTKRAEIGEPATQIINAAIDEQVDLIALATHRESKLVRGILGSVTDRVIHGSSIPVMTIRPKDRNGKEPRIPDAVIVPLDGSKRAESAIPIATEIAENSGAKIVFVRATDTLHYSLVIERGFYHRSSLWIKHMSVLAGEYLEPLVDTAKDRGIAAIARIPSGKAAGSIMGIADEYKDTLIVMSTQGASGLKRWILGSVTDRIVRVSGHPVLIVP